MGDEDHRIVVTKGVLPTCHFGPDATKKPAKISNDLTAIVITCQRENWSPWGQRGSYRESWMSSSEMTQIGTSPSFIRAHCASQRATWHIEVKETFIVCEFLLWTVPLLFLETDSYKITPYFLLTLLDNLTFFQGLEHVITLLFRWSFLILVEKKIRSLSRPGLTVLSCWAFGTVGWNWL